MCGIASVWDGSVKEGSDGSKAPDLMDLDRKDQQRQGEQEECHRGGSSDPIIIHSSSTDSGAIGKELLLEAAAAANHKQAQGRRSRAGRRGAIGCKSDSAAAANHEQSSDEDLEEQEEDDPIESDSDFEVPKSSRQPLARERPQPMAGRCGRDSAVTAQGAGNTRSAAGRSRAKRVLDDSNSDAAEQDSGEEEQVTTMSE